MTAMELDLPPAPEVPAKRTLPAHLLLSWPALVAAAAVGTLIVGYSYRLSAAGAAPNAYYAVFWIGMLLGVLPVGARIALRSTATADRGWAVALLGALTFMPKYLRNPTAPAYHDEYAHWREALDVLGTGHLFQVNALIPIVQFFPGTSALTVALQRLTGLSMWSAGELVLFAAHMLALFGVFVLARAHLRTARAGAIAALIYGLNPSAIYFDTQYAYEGIAVGIFVWVLAFASLASRSTGRTRITYTISAVVCAAGCVVTHHLTTLFLVMILVIVAVLVTVRARWTKQPDPAVRTWWLVLGGTVAAAATWLLTIAGATISYLSPYFGGSVKQLSAIGTTSDTSRVLLAPSVQPLWERGLTALAPVVLALFCLRLLLILRRGAHRDLRSDTLALMAFGLVYFPSVLFLLAPSGAEGARRSWAFSYVGLALIGAYLLERRSPSKHVRPAWTRPVALTAALAVLLMGNVGGGLNDPYRFPGPFRWGTDTNSASAEAETVAQELAAEVGPVRVVTDRYTALQLIAYGGLDVAAPSTGFPAWELLQKPTDPSSSLAGMLYTSGYDYVVVDIRMGEQAAFNGDNFGSGDLFFGKPTPMAYLDRLDDVPWASRIMTTEHLRVYRLDLPLIGRTLAGGS